MSTADKKKELISQIEKVAGRYSAYEVFTDWIRCMAMSISNSLSMIQDKIWKEREEMYLTTMGKYSPEEQKILCGMTAILVDILEDGPDDVLGDVYMKSGMGSKAAGQFFTPFHLSVLTAKTGLDVERARTEVLTVNEPSCGGGGMIIAAAKVLHDAGINYQKQMRVVAQDLDWKGVYMCYVQLSLLGISAICVQGNTLHEPFDTARTERSHMMFTPAYMGVLV